MAIIIYYFHNCNQVAFALSFAVLREFVVRLFQYVSHCVSANLTSHIEANYPFFANMPNRFLLPNTSGLTSK